MKIRGSNDFKEALFIYALCIEGSVKYCPNCAYKLAGTEKFCPECSYKLAIREEPAINIDKTLGDVIAPGASGSGNIIAKDTKGNMFYFNIGSISPDQLKSIITSSATLDVSQSQIIHNINLQKVTETKEETSKVLAPTSVNVNSITNKI